MRPPFVFFACFLFVISIKGQEEEISQEQLTQKVEDYILESKLDSAAVFFKRLQKNNYTIILGKIKNKELVSYVDYELFLRTVSSWQSIGLLSVSNFINEFVKEPDNLGLRLVNRLVKQLDGTLKLSNENGARFEIIFKDIHARKLVD